MKISVYLTTYNQEKYIEESLLGILNQIRKPDQVIISDDASQDETALIIEKFIEKNNLENKWIFLKSDYNLGILGNHKKCFKLITGDIFIGMAGDDISLPRRLLITEKIFNENKHIAAIATSGYKISSSGKNIGKIELKDKKLLNSVNSSIKLGFAGVFPVGFAYSSRILKTFEKLTDNLKNEDDQLVFLSILSGGIIFSKEKTFKYRIHNNSASSWLRDLNYNKFIENYHNDLENRINNYKNWQSILCLYGNFQNEKINLEKKIEIYKLISKSLYKNFFKSAYVLIKNWNYLCARERITLLFGPNVIFLLKKFKKLIKINGN